MRKLELLSPAGNADIGIEAIRHGADAVYIGPPSHGARQAASNSYDDISRLVDFAHTFNARVYVTVNTLVYDHELSDVERMIRRLYDIGVDALIVQDMGILRMDIPPIALHASTQCDIRTPGKARFLQEAGFSQLVLARELSISQIKEICDAVSIPVETFVHGALCVSYSGRCSMGFAAAGRSGNRGECPQICRQAFTLRDADGKVLAKDKYLLSLKDFRAEHQLGSLIEAGVSSFKIEGRLKEAGYVKNVTAAYSRRLNEIIGRLPGSFCRESSGLTELKFTPDLSRSFNRGFTDYMLSGSADRHGVASLLTPKSLGEPITDISRLRPGDGISFFSREGEYQGVQVNGIRDGKIISNRPFSLPKGVEIRRTSSVEWKKLMAGNTAVRFIPIDVEMSASGVSATEKETGLSVSLPYGIEPEKADKQTDYRRVFERLGATPFRLENFTNTIPGFFFPLSLLSELRRKLVEKLLLIKKETYRRDSRREENISFPYPSSSLDYRDNVANRLSRKFYQDHGVLNIEPALEVQPRANARGKIVMSSRHCILRELGMCLKTHPHLRQPLTLESGKLRFTPVFDCSRCEMHLRN